MEAMLSRWISGRAASIIRRSYTTGTKYFVSPSELKPEAANSLRFVATSWAPGKSSEELHNAFNLDNIPNSHYFNIEDVSSKTSKYPNMLPPKEVFEIWMEEFGIKKEDSVVLYENLNFMAGPRVLWMFHVFGHADVQLLDGGLTAWKRQFPDNQGWPRQKPQAEEDKTTDYYAEFNKHLVVEYPAILENVKSKTFQLLDARAPERFHGKVKEPKANMHSGHVPNAKNIPFSSLVRPDGGALKSIPELRKIFEDNKVDLNSPIVCMCNSGVTSCSLYLAAKQLGASNVAVYDGSWQEYGSHSEAPVATD